MYTDPTIDYKNINLSLYKKCVLRAITCSFADEFTCCMRPRACNLLTSTSTTSTNSTTTTSNSNNNKNNSYAPVGGARVDDRATSHLRKYYSEDFFDETVSVVVPNGPPSFSFYSNCSDTNNYNNTNMNPTITSTTSTANNNSNNRHFFFSKLHVVSEKLFRSSEALSTAFFDRQYSTTTVPLPFSLAANYSLWGAGTAVEATQALSEHYFCHLAHRRLHPDRPATSTLPAAAAVSNANTNHNLNMYSTGSNDHHGEGTLYAVKQLHYLAPQMQLRCQSPAMRRDALRELVQTISRTNTAAEQQKVCLRCFADYGTHYSTQGLVFGEQALCYAYCPVEELIAVNTATASSSVAANNTNTNNTNCKNAIDVVLAALEVYMEEQLRLRWSSNFPSVPIPEGTSSTTATTPAISLTAEDTKKLEYLKTKVEFGFMGNVCQNPNNNNNNNTTNNSWQVIGYLGGPQSPHTTMPIWEIIKRNGEALLLTTGSSAVATTTTFNNAETNVSRNYFSIKNSAAAVLGFEAEQLATAVEALRLCYMECIAPPLLTPEVTKPTVYNSSNNNNNNNNTTNSSSDTSTPPPAPPVFFADGNTTTLPEETFTSAAPSSPALHTLLLRDGRGYIYYSNRNYTNMLQNHISGNSYGYHNSHNAMSNHSYYTSYYNGDGSSNNSSNRSGASSGYTHAYTSNNHSLENVRECCRSVMEVSWGADASMIVARDGVRGAPIVTVTPHTSVIFTPVTNTTTTTTNMNAHIARHGSSSSCATSPPPPFTTEGNNGAMRVREGYWPVVRHLVSQKKKTIPEVTTQTLTSPNAMSPTTTMPSSANPADNNLSNNATTVVVVEDVYDYLGEWKEGAQHGYGVSLWAAGDVDCGQYSNNKKNGLCVYYFCGGDKYEGNLRDSVFDGQGVYCSAEQGYRYEGSYLQGKRHGLGTMFYATGDVYTGHYENNQKHGEGTFYYIRSGDVYRGNWVHDKKCGHGTYYYQIHSDTNQSNANSHSHQSSSHHHLHNTNTNNTNNNNTNNNANSSSSTTTSSNINNHSSRKKGDCYVGEFKNNAFHGKGTLYDAQGNVIKKGTWQYGALVS